jgi:acyl-CoA synthetase (AMP-forming)/AMP-acid ligase II
MAIGNGLRQDIFAEFKDRFAIPKILEFYGSTEGVAGFVNVFNVTGACGRSSPFLVRQMFLYLFVHSV